MTNVVYQRDFIADMNGLPLDSGKLYVGAANQDPQTNPLACFWDESLSIPATQPVAVSAGYILHNGSRAALYISASTYSMRILDRTDALVDYVPLSSIETSLRESLVGTSGAGLIGTTAGDTVQAELDALNHTALLVRGPKSFARNMAEAQTMAADVSAMRGYASYASTTGGAGKTLYRVWNAHDSANTAGCLRWAVAQSSSAGGLILFDTRGFFDIQLGSLLVIPSNVTIDAPGRNVRISATNETHMLRVTGQNVFLRRLNISRRPSLTDVDSEQVSYTATAGQTAFDVTYPFSDNAELRVYRNSVLLVLTTDYTVSGAGSSAGGRITLVSAASAGETIDIYGDIYAKDGLSIDPCKADKVWVDQCTFTEHSDGALDIASSALLPTVAATALAVGNRYTITTLGTTNWNTVAGTSAVTYSTGMTITCVVVGTGTGVARSADCRVTVSNCVFRRQDKTSAVGSTATSLAVAPSWAATALSLTPILMVTFDSNVYEGCGQRCPRVGPLAFAHKVNNVHIISGYRRDDGTTSAIEGSRATTGGKILSECDYLKLGSPESGAIAMYADTAAWNSSTRIGPGAFKSVGSVAENSLAITTANLSDVPTPPYSISPVAIPSSAADRLAYVVGRLAACGAETAPLSEMWYTFTDQATGDAAGLYADGYNVIATTGGYRVRVRDDMPASGVDFPSDLEPTSMRIKRGSTLTIASDTIALGGDMCFAVDTESAAATDTLSTITGGEAGTVIIFRIVSNSRTITVSSAGNIKVPNDVLLDSTGRTMALQYDTGVSAWIVLWMPSNVFPGSFTVANLPSVGKKGRRAFASDATVTTFASIAAGGGANNVPVYDDGTNWRIG